MAKKTKVSDQEKTIDQLKLVCTESAENLYKLRNEYRLNRKLDKPHLLKKYRKDIARALTAINMKQTQEHKVK